MWGIWIIQIDPVGSDPVFRQPDLGEEVSRQHFLLNHMVEIFHPEGWQLYLGKLTGTPSKVDWVTRQNTVGRCSPGRCSSEGPFLPGGGDGPSPHTLKRNLSVTRISGFGIKTHLHPNSKILNYFRIGSFWKPNYLINTHIPIFHFWIRVCKSLADLVSFCPRTKSV